MYKQISESEFNKLLDSYEQGGTYQKKKTMVTELEKKTFLKIKNDLRYVVTNLQR